jgi:DNA-binding transcriptional MerR regulator
MRVAELSRLTGVAVPTLKYYLREGLLPPGVRTSPNQARYGEDHVRRVTMVRAMVDIGGLSIAGTKAVLAALDDPDHPGTVTAEMLGTMPTGLPAPATRGSPEVWQAAQDRITKLITSLGWQANTETPAGHALVAAVAALYDLDRDDLVDLLEPYAAVCAELARIDMSVVDHGGSSRLEGVVIGTVIGDVVLLAIRRLAHQDAAARHAEPPEVSSGLPPGLSSRPGGSSSGTPGPLCGCRPG